MAVQFPEEERLSPTEIQWLHGLHQFTQSYLFCAKEGNGNSAKTLSDCVVECIRTLVSSSDWSHEENGERAAAHLPVSYRFVSVAQLQMQQRTPCCSYLKWSTEQFRTWSQEGKNLLPSYETFCRTHLIFLGYLTDQISDGGSMSGDAQKPGGGSLYVKDNSGIMACEILNPDVSWLEQLVLFPGWSYIPACSEELGTSEYQKGYLEVIIPPVKVFRNLNLSSDQRPQPAVALFPHSASQLLSNRFRCTTEVDVAGELARVSPLLHIRRKTFFFFFLQPLAGTVGPCVPIIVQVPSKLKWHPCFCLERHYIVTNVRVSRLKSCDQKVFVVTDYSQLHIFEENSVRERGLNELMQAGGLQRVNICTNVVEASMECSHAEWSSLETIEEKSTKETRVSKLLSYRGTITKVLNVEAGLYELDGKVGLCVSYQPMLNGGRGLRPGASIELHDVHLLLKPSEHFPSIMLGCCLRSSLKVIDFSRYSSPYQHFSTQSNLLIHLLFKYNLHLPYFLWVVYILENLTDRFCPSYINKWNLLHCSNTGKPGVAERYLGLLLETLQLKKEKRDLYKEILEDPHQCPLKEYYALKSPCRVLCLADICVSASEFSWKSFILPNFVSDTEIQYMTSQELNRKIAWSFQILPQEHFQQEQVALLGVLKANCKSAYLQLADQTATVDCIVLQKSENFHQTPFCDASFLGSLLQIDKYHVIVERFQRSDYPSWEQLGSSEFIREKCSRVYIQFFIDDVFVLNPSASFIKQNCARRIPNTSTVVQRQSLHADIRGHKNTDNINATVIEGLGCSIPSKMPKLEGFRHQEEQGDANSSKHMAEEDKFTSKQENHLDPPMENLCDPPQNVNCQEGHCFVTQLFLVTHKEGIMLKNCHSAKKGCTNTEWPSRVQGGLRPCFQTSAVSIGEPRLWKQNAEIDGIPELQELSRTWNANPLSQKLQLMFVGGTVKWFNTIHSDNLYRLIAPKEMDLKIFEKHCISSVPWKALHVSDCPLCLAVQKDWKLQYVTHISAVTQYQNIYTTLTPGRHQLLSVAEILSTSFTESLVSFVGLITERINCEADEKIKITGILTEWKEMGISSLQQCSLRLTVADLLDPAKTVNVYMDLGCLLYPLGLLPGAKLIFNCLERKYSRSNKIYCKYVPSSCLTVISFPSAESQRVRTSGLNESTVSSFPFLYLFDLHLHASPFTHGQVFCHITSVLQLNLQWLCTLCHSIFKQAHCTRTCPPCPSSSGVFLANAKFLVEDGTAVALVLCKNIHVKSLLGLSQREWEGLQKEVALTGDVYIKHQGKQAGCKYEEDSEDILPHYLKKLCASSKVCRSVMLFFNVDCNTKQNGNSDSIQLRRFTRGDCEFITKMASSLLLTCLNIKEADYRALCHAGSAGLMQ